MHHRLLTLLSEFEKEFPGTEFAATARKYTVDLDQNSPLGLFFATNGVSIDDWFEALKYPELRSGQAIIHVDLKGGGTRTLGFWEAIGSSAVQLRKLAVELSVSLQ